MLGWLFFGILGFIVLGVYPFRYSGDINQMSHAWQQERARVAAERRKAETA